MHSTMRRLCEGFNFDLDVRCAPRRRHHRSIGRLRRRLLRGSRLVRSLLIRNIFFGFERVGFQLVGFELLEFRRGLDRGDRLLL